MPAFLMIIQEASMQNSIDLKFSILDMKEDKISWVLLRKELNITRLPCLGETIQVKTFPSGFDRILAYRDYLVFDAQGSLLATAASTWTLMDLVKRSLLRIPEKYFHLKPPAEAVLLPRADSRFHFEEVVYTHTYTVDYFDIDWNGHVNNLVYIRMSLSALPMEWHLSHQLKSMSYQIKAECLYKEFLTVQVSKQTDQLGFQVIKEDGSIAFMARAEVILN